MKPVEFVGDSLDRLRLFPGDVRRAAGFQLYRVQGGLEPLDWKPMASVGAGACEIRIREESGAYRRRGLRPNVTLNWQPGAIVS